MQILPASPQAITEAIHVLSQGGIVVHATETCYGIACDLRNPDAVAKLFAVKNRPDTQLISALFSSTNQARMYVQWTALAEDLARNYLPGPLTIVLPLRPDAPDHLYPLPATRHPLTLGVRISSHPLAMQLAKEFSFPVATTSANVHGRPEVYAIPALLGQLGEGCGQPDLIIDSGPLPKKPPSTVVEVVGEEWKVLRKGSIDTASRLKLHQ